MQRNHYTNIGKCRLCDLHRLPREEVSAWLATQSPWARQAIEAARVAAINYAYRQARIITTH